MKLVEPDRDYVGKDVFVGIDVHKKTYAVTARCEGLVVKKFTQLADPAQLSQSLLRWFSGARIAAVYEAGFSGFGLYRHLIAKGIKCLVVNPASLEVESNNRVKTDKRDASRMAEKLEDDKIVGIYVPSLQEELDRQYQRTRSQLVKSRVRIANQLKGKLLEFGFLSPTDDQVVSAKFISKIRRLSFPVELEFCVSTIISQWEHLTKLIRETERKIKEQIANGSRQIQIIRSVPGFGDISTITISTEIASFLRFRNEKTIFSYVGLTPSEHSSGEHRRLGNISRQGSSRLRHVLTEAAWRAIKQDSSLGEAFFRIAARRGKKKAIVAIARKLVGRIRACVWNDVEFVTT